jgi:hypothetical protein
MFDVDSVIKKNGFFQGMVPQNRQTEAAWD